MARLASLLRGINVGGARKIPMPELRTMYERLGLTNVASYIQSGNVVFDAADPVDELDVSDRIEKALAETFGYDDIDVMIRGGAALDRIVASNPFAAGDVDRTSLHVWFFVDEPEQEPFAPLHDIEGDETFTFGPERVVYLSLPGGIGRSKLAAKMAKVAGSRVTSRNWRTTMTLQQMVND